MDSNTRIYFLRGRLRMPSSEITPKEWATLLEDAYNLVRPHLNYMSDFRELSGILNNRSDDYTITPLDLVDFPSSVTPDTRCTYLSTFLHQPSGEPQFYGLPYLSIGKLLLTQSGDWLRWDARYNRNPVNWNNGRIRFNDEPARVDLISEYSKFTRVSFEDLERLFSQCSSEVPYNTLQRFEKLLKDTINHNTVVLQGLREKHEQTKAVLTRISPK